VDQPTRRVTAERTGRCARHGIHDDTVCCLPANLDVIAALDAAQDVLVDDARRQVAEIGAAKAEELPEGYDPTAHRCPLCCPPDQHRTVEAPYWLLDSALMPAHWRFVYHVIFDVKGAEPTVQERADAARLYAQVYGERALARAIREAKQVPMPHPKRWHPMWDGILLKLHKAAA
jgi:hypothetical protein